MDPVEPTTRPDEGRSAVAQPPRPAPLPATRIELVKAVLDFLGKCLYPAILVAVLYALWPAFAAIDIRGLAGRLQSAKAGDVELTFAQAQEVGAGIAPLNSKLAELERALASARNDIARLQSVTPAAPPSTQATPEAQARERAWKANGDYTLLVFHRAGSRSRSAALTQALLGQGYQSSDTETDFSELQRITPEDNVVYLTYTGRGLEVLPEVEKLIAQAAPGVQVKRHPRSINLRRGDVQVLVF